MTGLCLQGNKGGPALALSLQQEIQRVAGPCSFTFSVPYAYWERECMWADRLGIGAVPDFSPGELLPLRMFKGGSSACRRVGRWLSSLRSAELVIEMSGVSYVGPPAGDVRTALRNRFRYFVLARLYRKRFLAWTQSYGPFSTWVLRAFARLDLRQQEVIFCRGEECRDAVQELLPRKRTETYPDVAVTLASDVIFGRAYIESHVERRPHQPLVTLSPSSVLHAKTRREGRSSGHVLDMVELVQELARSGYAILLVPHTTRPDRPDPNVCDLEVCRRIGALSGDQIVIVEDDLAPTELKGIIAAASVHVGARYHSIVAGLSSAVPCVSLSWHPKYRDVMRFFGMENFVVDGQGPHVAAKVSDLVSRILDDRPNLETSLQIRQLEAVAQVRRNTESFLDLARRPST